jgi:hypothetical protein
MNNNKKLEDIAKRILKQANIPNDQKFGSIIAILMMVSIILTLVRVIQECNKTKTNDMTYEQKSGIYAESIRSYSKKRGWFTRLRIKKILRRELPKEDYHKYGIKLTEILMDNGENITDDEALTLVEESNV